MATPTKSATVLLTPQQIASNSVLKGSVQDVSTKFAGTFYLWLGRDDTVGVLTTGVDLRLEGSGKASGDDAWIPLVSFRSGVATPEAEAVSGTEAAAATVIEVASTTNLAVGDLVLLKNSTIGNSEFGEIIAVVSNTSITLLDGLTNAQTGSTWYNRGERFVFAVDVTSFKRLRVICNNNYGASAVAINWRCACITADSLSTT